MAFIFSAYNYNELQFISKKIELILYKKLKGSEVFIRPLKFLNNPYKYLDVWIMWDGFKGVGRLERLAMSRSVIFESLDLTEVERIAIINCVTRDEMNKIDYPTIEDIEKEEKLFFNRKREYDDEEIY